MKHVLFDGKYYYLIRSLNDGNLRDLENGISGIRADAERYRDRHGVYGKYSDESLCSFEEVFDHIKMQYRKDTNCISLTRNASVALTYYKSNARYVLVRVSEEDFTKFFDAGEYLLAGIEERIAGASVRADNGVIEILEKIDRAETQEEIKLILSEYNESITQFAIREKQYLTNEEQSRIDKTIAKLKVLEHNGFMDEIVQGTSNQFVVATMGNAYSSAEYISYGSIPKDKVLECPGLFLDALSLIQQVEYSGEHQEDIERISSKVIGLISEGYHFEINDGVLTCTNGEKQIEVLEHETPIIMGYTSKDDMYESLDVEKVYEATDGRLSYNDVRLQTLGIKALSEMKLKQMMVLSMLEKMLPEENVREVLGKTFCLNPDFLLRQNGKGYQINDTVNVLISKNGYELNNETTAKLLAKIDGMAPDELQNILSGNYELEDIIELMQLGYASNITDRYSDKFGDYIDKKKLNYHGLKSQKEKYMLEAMLEGINWQEFGRQLTISEKKEIIQKILPKSNGDDPTNLSGIYKALRESGLEDENVFAAIINMAIDGQTGSINYRELLLLDNDKQREILTANIEDLCTTLEPINIDLLTRRGKTVEKIRAKAFGIGVEEKLIAEVDIRNLNAAINLIEGYDFENAVGRNLTETEKRVLLEQIISRKALSKESTGYLSVFMDNLKSKGLSQEEAFEAVMNYALGYGNGSYTEAIKYKSQFKMKSKDEIVVGFSREKIDQMMFETVTTREENQRRIEELGVNAENIDYRNIDAALKILDGYDFNAALGRELTQDEQRGILNAMFSSKTLESNSGIYISSLLRRIMDKGLSREDAYAGVINLVSTRDGTYIDLLHGQKSFYEDNEEKIRAKITEETIARTIFGKDVQTEQNLERLKAFGITVDGISERNIDSALKIIDGYDFETNIGRSLTQTEQRVLLESIFGNNSLTTTYTCVLGSLVENLMAKGMTREEAYGAVINLSLGKGNYTKALSNREEFQKLSKEEIPTAVTTEMVDFLIFERDVRTEHCLTRTKELGVDIGKTEIRNIDSALKIIENYDFEGKIGRGLTETEQRLLLEKMRNNASLNDGQFSYISTLVGNLLQKGMTSDEAYGAVMNYALGKENYTEALHNMGHFPLAGKEDIATNITEDTILQLVIEEEIDVERDTQRLYDLGVVITKPNVKNVSAALKVLDGCDFETRLGRPLTTEEQKMFVEVLLNNSRVQGAECRCYISTLVRNLKAKGLNHEEACAAVINCASGYGKVTYREALKNEATFREYAREDIQIDITTGTLDKANLKQARKMRAIMKSSVTRENVEKKDEIIGGLTELAKTNTKEVPT